MDAWAELRVIDQLHREGFIDIHKVTATADFVAKRGEQTYAFQVTRIGKLLSSEVKARSDWDPAGDDIGYGGIGEVYKRLSTQLFDQLPRQLLTNQDAASQPKDSFGPLSYYFWDALEIKNGKFKRWTEEGYTRCIVVISNDEDLQDTFVRHVACRLIREAIHAWLPKLHFEELLWLPDLGNGAWFKVGSRVQDTQCWVDWSDGPERPDEDTVRRREMDLDSVIP